MNTPGEHTPGGAQVKMRLMPGDCDSSINSFTLLISKRSMEHCARFEFHIKNSGKLLQLLKSRRLQLAVIILYNILNNELTIVSSYWSLLLWAIITS
jgi:hypothetical protein